MISFQNSNQANRNQGMGLGKISGKRLNNEKNMEYSIPVKI